MVAFTFGFVSHQVADVTWHSLGIKQGFLRTMGDVNFFGSFPAAHSVGDPGGDMIAAFEGDIKPISDSFQKWQVHNLVVRMMLLLMVVMIIMVNGGGDDDDDGACGDVDNGDDGSGDCDDDGGTVVIIMILLSCQPKACDNNIMVIVN